MGRAPCCEKIGLRRGRWTAEEDEKLSNYIQEHGEGSWRSLPKNAGLLRCGKSCRLRWINYLRSDVKRGNISPEEEDTIIKLQASLGNKWSLIASHLSGRTDNEIKNYWNSHLRRRVSPATTPYSKRRTSAAKVKKPRKKSATPPPENQSKMNKENEGVLMESTNEVLNSLNCVSSSMDDSNQLVNDEVEWQWEWDINDGGDNMLGLGFGGEEDDDIIMSWPWESLTHDDDDDDLGVDVNKQDEIIAWLLS